MRIKLKKPHTHAGRKYPAGAELDLPVIKAEWLKALGVAEEAPAPDVAAQAEDKPPRAKTKE